MQFTALFVAAYGSESVSYTHLDVYKRQGAGGAGSIYYYFFAKQFQLTKTTYIYIDRDDNLDSVYHKIIRNGHPKSMFGFQYLDRKSTRLNSSHLKLSRMPSSA